MPSAFYRVHDKNVHLYHAPGEPVYNLIAGVTMAGAELARLYTGKRTGKLMRSIQGNKPNQTGGYKIAGLLFANAKHAHWHHEGTLNRAPRPKHGRYMTVPRRWSKISGGQLRKEWLAEGSSRGDKPYFLATAISGQKPNPYLKDGIEAAMARDTRLTFTGI